MCFYHFVKNIRAPAVNLSLHPHSAPYATINARPVII
jgi:hypothetical protein